MTIAERLKKTREEMGYSQKQIADTLNCHIRSWAFYESGTNIPGGEVLSNLAKLGADINWILTGKQGISNNTINIYNVEFSAGCGSFISEENITSSLNLPDDFFNTYNLNKKQTAGVYIKGDSMQPKFNDKDIAIVDMSVEEFIKDGTYAFVYDGSCFIKKLQLTGKTLKVVSLNPEYTAWNIENDDQLHIVGLVKAAICKV